MITVIFEVVPHASHMQDYLDAAARLRGHLETMDGFISVERFQSLAQPGKVLSLSFWRDEEAVLRWRNHELHRQIQSEGRDRLFEDYRQRVAAVLRDYDMRDRAEAPPDSRDRHG